ncbi:hypothetical protein F8S12_14510 [Nostoc sp. WHI]|nr:hypothetical protein [Nostoc sp. WHI]MBG1267547.1 hypothetical protein [Nostoc sp. WHI]
MSHLYLGFIQEGRRQRAGGRRKNGVLGLRPDFSRYLKNLSLNLSPKRRETLNFPPSRHGKGVRGLGFRGLIHIT